MQHKFGTPNAPTPQRPLAVQVCVSVCVCVYVFGVYVHL